MIKHIFFYHYLPVYILRYVIYSRLWLRSPKNSAWEALPPTPAVEVMTPDAAQVEHAPAREGSRLSEGVTLDDQHHKDFATAPGMEM